MFSNFVLSAKNEKVKLDQNRKKRNQEKTEIYNLKFVPEFTQISAKLYLIFLNK